MLLNHAPNIGPTLLRLNPHREDIALLKVACEGGNTSINKFDTLPLFEEDDFSSALNARGEDGILEGLLLRGLSMHEPLRIDVFAEDRAHEEFLKPLVSRVANDLQASVDVRVLSARGGRPRVHKELQTVQKFIEHGVVTRPDILVIAVNANCKGLVQARSELQALLMPSLQDISVLACPDPHIERWFMVDPDAFAAVVGCRPDSLRYKCGRDRYKSLLVDAIKRAEHPVLLGGIDWAPELVERIDLFKAGKNDNSFRGFVDALKGMLQRLSGTSG